MEIQLDNIIDINEEYEKIMHLQDKLIEIIENLQSQSEINNLENTNNNLVFDSESESNSDSDSDSNLNKKKVSRKKKLKPYFLIGKIPDGYREATQEEAIIKKKVNLFGKYKVSRELYNIHNVTGTLCINGLTEKDIKLKIIALKGKLRYYKKEYEYEQISLSSNKISEIHKENIKKKIEELQNNYKKTIDVINFYVQSLNNLDKIKK